MDEQAGYTGVVYSESCGGYSDPQGYEGVVCQVAASGYTGSISVKSAGPGDAGAPVTSAPSAGGDRPILRSESEVGMIPVVTSPYDHVVASPRAAPGQQTPLEAVAPPIVFDLDAVTDGAEGARSGSAQPMDSQDASGGEAAPELPVGLADPTTSQLADFTREWLGLYDRLTSESPPQPNAELERARRALSGAAPAAMAMAQNRPADWIRRLGEAVERQVGLVIATSRPSSLGAAYLQGILRGVADSAIEVGSGTLAQVYDPVGAGMANAVGVIAAIDIRMSQGEGFWESLNSTFNPATEVLKGAWRGNDLAGKALAAAQRGDWQGAVELARDAGQNVARSGLAVPGTILTAVQGVGNVSGGTHLRQRGNRPKRPGLPTPPRNPAPGPESLSNVAVEYPVRLVELPPPSPAVTPSRRSSQAFPDVPILDSRDLRVRRPLEEAVLRRRQGEAAVKLSAMSEAQRLDSKRRIAVAKPILNSYERLNAMDLQLAHPDRAYLTDVRVEGIVTPKGHLSVEGITGPIDGTKTRVFDNLELRPDGTFRDVELKTRNAILEAYPRRAFSPESFKKGTALGRQIKKTDAIFDYAQKEGGKVRIVGTTLEGMRVELMLDPAKFLDTIVTSYRMLPN